MIIGVGLDLVELSRIEKLITRQARFPQRVLTQKELLKYETMSERRKIEYVAGRFAAKEAYAKALGTGIGSELSFQDIEIQANEKGKPFIHSQHAKCHLTITHTVEYAAAQVILEQI